MDTLQSGHMHFLENKNRIGKEGRTGIVVLEWMLSASLSGISMLNSSSMAMTTSTVSRLSRPRSLAKWAVGLIC